MTNKKKRIIHSAEVAKAQRQVAKELDIVKKKAIYLIKMCVVAPQA
ncbi:MULTISPECIES: hypothetical protein [Vibrio harveyi group]|nr:MULTISPECIES: hypothetical protein [Vibrio harveyi group]MBS9834890.1 hypothetical protein [Vibrio alginolyticus]WHT05983.1 hypothetical protein O2T11_24215 [Vibrio parahaemolyticus]HBC3983212.1 hypothetical protein [Vibrio parahaemolyticus]